MKIHDKIYINGEWVRSRFASSIEVHNAATEELIATVPAGVAEDVELAVAAARAAFGPWAATPVERRSV